MLVVSSVRVSAIGRVRMMVAASADTVCSVIQKMFLRGLNIVRYLPVITPSLSRGSCCVYIGMVWLLSFLGLAAGGGEVAAAVAAVACAAGALVVV